MSGENVYDVRATGNNRREVLEDAKKQAAEWYEVPEGCVATGEPRHIERDVEYSYCGPDVAGPFTATVGTWRAHKWDSLALNPGKTRCTDCGATL